MRILVLTNLYPNPFQPNRVPFNRHLVRRLAQVHPVTVIAPILWTDEARARWRGAAALPPDRRVELDGVSVVHPRYYYMPKIMRRYYGHFFKASVQRTFRRVVADFHPDIVHALWSYPDGWTAVRLCRAAGLPVVIKVHGSDVRQFQQFPARRPPTAEALQSADGILTVSRDLATQVAGMGVPPERIRVVYNGVNTELFHPGPKADARSRLGLPLASRQLVFIGNLVPVKGVDILITACQRLRQAGMQFVLNVIGEGPLHKSLEAQVRRLELSEMVRFLGPKAHKDLPDWFRAADLFVLPSHSEGVPNVLLEAAACGTPWAATAVGGIPEIAHFGNSRMVPPNDPAALASAMQALLCETPDATKPLFSRSPAAMAQETLDFLGEVLARSRATSTSRNGIG